MPKPLTLNPTEDYTRITVVPLTQGISRVCEVLQGRHYRAWGDYRGYGGLPCTPQIENILEIISGVEV